MPRRKLCAQLQHVPPDPIAEDHQGRGDLGPWDCGDYHSLGKRDHTEELSRKLQLGADHKVWLNHEGSARPEREASGSPWLTQETLWNGHPPRHKLQVASAAKTPKEAAQPCLPSARAGHFQEGVGRKGASPPTARLWTSLPPQGKRVGGVKGTEGQAWNRMWVGVLKYMGLRWD